MADYGFKVTRDSCGAHGYPEIIKKEWDIDKAREIMQDAAEKEARQLEKDGKNVMVIHGDDAVEVRDGADQMLIAYYEVREFQQR